MDGGVTTLGGAQRVQLLLRLAVRWAGTAAVYIPVVDFLVARGDSGATVDELSRHLQLPAGQVAAALRVLQPPYLAAADELSGTLYKVDYRKACATAVATLRRAFAATLGVPFGDVPARLRVHGGGRRGEEDGTLSIGCAKCGTVHGLAASLGRELTCLMCGGDLPLSLCEALHRSRGSWDTATLPFVVPDAARRDPRLVAQGALVAALTRDRFHVLSADHVVAAPSAFLTDRELGTLRSQAGTQSLRYSAPRTLRVLVGPESAASSDAAAVLPPPWLRSAAVSVSRKRPRAPLPAAAPCCGVPDASDDDYTDAL